MQGRAAGGGEARRQRETKERYVCQDASRTEDEPRQDPRIAWPPAPADTSRGNTHGLGANHAGDDRPSWRHEKRHAPTPPIPHPHPQDAGCRQSVGTQLASGHAHEAGPVRPAHNQPHPAPPQRARQSVSPGQRCDGGRHQEQQRAPGSRNAMLPRPLWHHHRSKEARHHAWRSRPDDCTTQTCRACCRAPRDA